MMKYPSTYQRPSKQEKNQEQKKNEPFALLFSSLTSFSDNDNANEDGTVVKTVEATLTRKLGIRFIDARSLATQAKINLNIFGYPNTEQEKKIIEEAVVIFESKSAEDRISLLELNDELESAKSTSSRTVMSENNSSLRSLGVSGSCYGASNSSSSSSCPSREQSKIVSSSPTRLSTSERSNSTINVMSRAQKLVRMLSAKKL